MPRGDGTGPMGMGSMTGRGVGNCVGYASSEFVNRGVGFGRGMGAGRGHKRMFCQTGIPGCLRSGYNTGLSNGQTIDEKALLKNQEGFFEKQLQKVKERLKDFDEQ